MLSAKDFDRAISRHAKPMEKLHGVKGKAEVKRVIPTLRPVATILAGETGLYRGMLAAVVYAMPDGELVRLPLSGHGNYEYGKARLLPKDHPIVLAHAENPDVEIKAEPSRKDHEGFPPSANDISWLKGVLEAQNKRIDKELRAQGLIP